MNPNFHHLLIFLLLLFTFHEISARSGGHGRGRSGARLGVSGRTKSGIRGNSARGRMGSRGSAGGKHLGSSSTGSSIRGSSSYSEGVRSGASGYKVNSKTSSFSDHGSSSFRTAHFGHSPNIQIRPGHPMVVLAASTPILFDNRNYYWNYNSARAETNDSLTPAICEYVFGDDDGELQNATFQNGTLIKAIYFGCPGRVNCCGMYCCHDFSQWLELAFVFGFIAAIIFIATYAKRHEKDGPQPYRRKKRKQKKVNSGSRTEMERLTSVSQIVKDRDSLRPK